MLVFDALLMPTKEDLTLVYAYLVGLRNTTAHCSVLLCWDG